MQFTTIAASLLAAAGLSAAAPLDARQAAPATCPAPTGDYVWKLSNFYARKPDGQKINSIGFNIKATNGGRLDFNCSASADTIVDRQWYSCGQNSFMWFAFQSDRNGIMLQQTVNDDVELIGTATLPNVCRAGGNGINDSVCTGVADAYITLVQYDGIDRIEVPDVDNDNDHDNDHTDD